MLELRQLACERGPRRLFVDLNLVLNPGELLRVQGANGAGKTSLLRMICGLVLPAQGQVLWQAQDVSSLREEFNARLLYLGHAAALKDDLTGLENLQFSSLLAGQSVTLGQTRSALVEAGLKGREHLPVRVLSQGQKRRVALARLCLAAPLPLWVLDEPFNALDTTAVRWLLDLIATHLARGGMVVLTSHQALDLHPDIRQVSLTL
jgi:heme exporter protein A